MASGGGYQLGAALCAVFGLPANRVRRLSLSFDASGVVRVDAELLPDAGELKDAERVLASFTFKVDRATPPPAAGSDR